MKRKLLRKVWEMACEAQREVCQERLDVGDLNMRSSADADFELPYDDEAEALVGFIEEQDLRSVAGMQKPLNKERAAWLLARHPRVALQEVLMAMENYKGLNRKYKSCKLTAHNWCKRRERDSGDQNRNDEYDEFD